MTTQASKKKAVKPVKTTGTGAKQAGTASVQRTVAMQRSIQKQVDAIEQGAGVKQARERTHKTGARRQPQNPMPAQHLKKPGNESDLELQPRFMAPDYKGSGKLQGLNAIVTGGDSGIGRAVAVLFAREGANVAVLYLNEKKDAAHTKKAVENEGTQCITIPGDVKDVSFCERAVRKVVKAFGGVDILINNAAFQEHCDALEDLTEDHLQETLQTNIGGYFHMARAVLPHLKAGSCIINTGSETGLQGHKSLLDYSATKGAIHAFTKSLASQLQPRGIRVNAVAPGPVWTPFNPADKQAKDVADFGKKSAMERPAQPEEVSPAYVFLASPVTASYVSGAILPVMGGPAG